MQDKNELFNLLVEALSALLGYTAKTGATQNGHTKIAPLDPITPQASVKFIS
ncbi:MAG: hypothetical protein SFW07_02405 [Gammaproteobacteria bacterium]|nr:hypothetical protein [Gammaproteobacteria bacterium]